MFPALHSIYCCNHQQKNPLDVFCFSCHATMFAEPTSYIVATTSRTTLFLAYGEGDESRGGVCVMLEWWSFFCLINVLARMKACACFFLGVLRECQSQWNLVFAIILGKLLTPTRSRSICPKLLQHSRDILILDPPK
eukprot:GEMP01044238.1.p1 GENE.GEMP01044238.1~~GEMP01044238.1.p1  ORF type:complete len:137 (+),score=0.68 GEMP01044238.1:309-719(+)